MLIGAKYSLGVCVTILESNAVSKYFFRNNYFCSRRLDFHIHVLKNVGCIMLCFYLLPSPLCYGDHVDIFFLIDCLQCCAYSCVNEKLLMRAV